MKKFITSAYSRLGRFVVIAVAGCIFSACSDFLDVPLESTVATSNFYKTAEEFDMGLTGVYNMLLSAEWANGDRYGSYFQGFLILGRVGTDEMIIPTNIDGNETELCNYTYTPSHRYISRTWYVQYRGIQRACVIIDRLTDTDIGNESEKKRILGEAYFLRAFYYFHLVRLFGEVPIINHEVTDLTMVQTEKSSVAQVYEQIVSDLKLAIGNLPVSNANGRAHYYAAKALLGKVYLQMAGEPLEDSEAAALAEVELNEVIQSGRFELVKDYFSLFDASNEYSSEYLFDVEFANNGTTTYGGQVGTIDGVQTPNNLYWSAVWSTQEFYETYDPADLRRDSNGDIYQDMDGNIFVDNKTQTKDFIKLGSVFPDANLAWRNDFRWRNFNFGFLLTARLGGVVYSRTQAVMDYYGVSASSADARDAGGIVINGNDLIDAQKWYQTVANGDTTPQYYTYSATNVRLQEASIGYTIPRKKLGDVCDITLSIVGRNLWMLYNKAPFDPEAVATTSNYYQGIDYFMMPSLRSIGFNVRVKF